MKADPWLTTAIGDKTMRVPNHFIDCRTVLLRRGALVAAGALLAACAGPGPAPEVRNTTVYFVRHAEPNFKDPDRPLNDKGRARAEKLVAHFAGTPITHLYASHTDRTRDTVMPLAKARGEPVKQFPPVGSDLDGKIVSNRTGGSVAIKPLISAVRSLPVGSTAVVAGNSGNLYPVIAGLGVRVDASCTKQSNDCVPCAARKCFPRKEFDNVWKLTFTREGSPALSRTTYGD
jgi:hypothetical protein